MGQRVNIQYSIDLDNLPEEAKRLLNTAVIKLKHGITDILPSLSQREMGEMLTLSTINDIERLRKTLSDADFILNDTMNIINGYISHLSSPPAQPQQQVRTPTSVDELAKKLQDFRAATEEDAE
jgi:hypothetical protein